MIQLFAVYQNIMENHEKEHFRYSDTGAFLFRRSDNGSSHIAVYKYIYYFERQGTVRVHGTDASEAMQDCRIQNGIRKRKPAEI